MSPLVEAVRLNLVCVCVWFFSSQNKRPKETNRNHRRRRRVRRRVPNMTRPTSMCFAWNLLASPTMYIYTKSIRLHCVFLFMFRIGQVPLATGDPFACDHCGSLLSSDRYASLCNSLFVVIISFHFSNSEIKHMTPKEHAAYAAQITEKYYALIPAPPLHAKFAKVNHHIKRTYMF